MSNRFGALVALALCVLTPQQALDAQTCAGRTAFRRGPVDVGGSASRTTNATEIDGRVAVGSATGLSGALTMASVSYDNSGQGANIVGVDASYSMAADVGRPISFCPLAGGSYRQGPKVEELNQFVDVSELVFNAGASVGTAIPASESLLLVPFVTGAYYAHSPHVNTNGETAKGNYSYLRIDVGTGLIFNSNVTVRPVVTIPVDSKQIHTSYGLSVSVNFGGQ